VLVRYLAMAESQLRIGCPNNNCFAGGDNGTSRLSLIGVPRLAASCASKSRTRSGFPGQEQVKKLWVFVEQPLQNVLRFNVGRASQPRVMERPEK